MVIKYNILSEEQVKEIEMSKYKTIENGDYCGTIFSAVEKVSKTGNSMIEIVIHIKDSHNCLVSLKDWLLPANENMYFKFKHLLESAGKAALLNGHINANDLVGLEVVARINNKLEKKETETGEEKEFYKSTIVDYVPLDKFQMVGKSDVITDDDIPF